MGKRIFYNFKPIIEKMRTIWVEDNCECGSNKIIERTDANGRQAYYCYGCNKRIEKGR